MDDAWNWWETELGSPRFVCAPMVDQSDLAFRKLVRRRQVDLCYSPMLLAKQLVLDAKDYRRRYLVDDLSEDRCVVQLAGNAVEEVAEAARLVLEAAPLTIAIDLNLGCPQRCASRGGFGAFLDHEKACDIVARLSQMCRVGCKIRIQDTAKDTVVLARRLAASGASFLAVHGRTREQRGRGDASWKMIKFVVDALDIPVIANGNVRTKEDAEDALRRTGAAAIMSAEPLLSVPGLFAGLKETRKTVAEEYLALATHTPKPWIDAHLLAMYHGDDSSRDEDCSPPTRRDLLLAPPNKLVQNNRAERHRFKAAAAATRKRARRAAPPTETALLAAANGHLLLCPRCANPARRTCIYKACRSCCAHEYSRVEGEDCGYHSARTQRKQQKVV